MQLTIKLVLGSALALMLGLAAASPILVQNLELGTKVQIVVDVVYAYFGVQEFNENITGLGGGRTDSHFVSYIIVLNVTNNSDKLAMIDVFEVASAPEILVVNGTKKIGSEELAKRFQTNQTSNDNDKRTEDGVSVAMENPIVTDARDLRRGYPACWSQYWSPKTSRLIGLTGIANIPNVSYDALIEGTVYLFGKAQGQPYEGGSYSTGFGLKQVYVQMFGREFLYNALLSENQILCMGSGVDVFIVTTEH